MARRRWARRAGAALGVVIALVASLFIWAALSTGSSTLARALIWMEADTGDRDRFPAREINRGERMTPLPRSHGPAMASRPLDDALAGTHTTAFVVVHDGRVVFERYFEGTDAASRATSFSVAKSFASTLVGIALDDGLIGSLADPVTDYVPELAERDARFAQITLRDLLTMSSGLRYEESDPPLPWGDDTYTYYGVNLRQEALERTEIVEPAGSRWHYNNYNPLLIGLVLERATGQPVSRFMAEELWGPLGAAADASWSLDSESSAFEKMESGLNATALDYARFGLLFLRSGRALSRQVVSRAWVEAATSPQIATDYDNPYGYFWWVDGQDRQRFYAFGNYGQYVYVAPDANTVVVRLGSDWGLENEAWLAMFREIAEDAIRRSEARRASPPVPRALPGDDVTDRSSRLRARADTVSPHG